MCVISCGIKISARAWCGVVGTCTWSWLLLLMVLMATASNDAPTPETADKEKELSVCRGWLSSQDPFQYYPPFLLFEGSDNDEGKDFVAFHIQSPLGYELRNYMLFHRIGTVKETTERTIFCLGVQDTTTWIHDEKKNNISVVRLENERRTAVGLMSVNSNCWSRIKKNSKCGGRFLPSNFLINLPMYHYSIYEEEFWMNFTSVGMGIPSSWIKSINIGKNIDFKQNISASSVSKLDIPTVEAFKISGNNWGKPENFLRPMPILKELDLSYNNLEALPKGLLRNVPQLERLFLNHNNISEFPTEISVLNLTLLDLNNPLGSATLKISTENIEKLPQTLEIIRLDNTKLNANVTKMLLLPRLTFLNLSSCGLDNLPDNDYNSSNEGNSSSKLVILDLSKNKLSSLPITAFQKLTSLQKLLLQRNFLTDWPKLNQKDTLTEINVHRNRFSRITSTTFANLHKLQTLDVSWNRIEYINSKAFVNNNGLLRIDLSYNILRSIAEGTFRGLQQLQEINLSHNFIKSFPALFSLDLALLDLSSNTLSEFRNGNASIKYVDISDNSVSNLDIKSIDKLNLSYNKFPVISPLMWRNIISLKQVDVGGNNFECCLFKETSFMKNRVETIIMNLGELKPLSCSVGKTTKEISRYEYNDTECAVGKISDSNIELEVYLPLGVLMIIISFMVIMVYLYKHELMYVILLLQMKKAGSISDEEGYKSSVYDAFVCYSAKNFAWVAGRLLPALERPPHAYRLCVHDRDFTLGAAIHRNIIASLEKSRKVILVLSQDFVASKWCQWELELANHKMFEEKRNSIVLVELERLERRRLPRHLRYLMARTTYLQWPTEGDAWVELQEETKGAFEGVGEVGTKQLKGMDEDERRRQRRLRREETCLRRLREALGESLSQRRGTAEEHVPHTVLESFSETVF